MSNHHLVNRPNRRSLRIDGPGGSILITRLQVFTPCHRLSRSVVNAPFVLLFGRDQRFHRDQRFADREFGAVR